MNEFQIPVLRQAVTVGCKQFTINLSTMDKKKKRHPKLFFVNCGDGTTRKWKDCYSLGFLSAGQMRTVPGYFSKQLKTLEIGDIVAAYFNDRGYVGIGLVLAPAVSINEFEIDGRKVSNADFSKGTNMFENSNNINAEHLVKIEWIKAVHEQSAKFKNPKPLRNVVCSLDNQPEVRTRLQRDFGVYFKEYIPNYSDK